MQHVISKASLQKLGWLLLAGALTALIYQVLRHAGVVEDAYITFRVVDNFVHGHGLRWNITERVQTYSNPLWLFLHIPFYALWQDIYHLTIAISLSCTLLAIYISYKAINAPPAIFAVFFVLPLALSYSVTGHSISGLENPLSHLLFAVFAYALLRTNGHYYWFYLSLFAGLSIINRLDMSLICAPALLYMVFKKGLTRQDCVYFMFGILPLLIWLIFSLWYYGFLFPNTKYAKLDTGISKTEYLHQGLRYLASLKADKIGAAMLLVGLLAIPFMCLAKRKKCVDATAVMLLAGGVLLYTFYIISVGGSFVIGRFWSLPIFACTWIVCFYLTRTKTHPVNLLLLALLAVMLAMPHTAKLWDKAAGAMPVSYTNAPIHWEDCKIKLLPTKHLRRPRICNSICPGCYKKGFNIMPARNSMQEYKIWGAAGQYPYFRGVNFITIDPLGITDPLLSRLPARNTKNLRTGHVRRSVPKGYLHAIKTGSTDKMHPSLAAYYEKLSVLTAGDLWSWNRLVEIIKFNRGDYDYLKNQYLRDTKQSKSKPARRYRGGRSLPASR